MRIFNILGGFAVMACSLIVSFSHSIQLAHLGGYTGNMAIIAVLGAEITFLMGALNILVSRIKGERVGASAIASFILGVVLILWSNIYSGVGFGWIGIIWGAFIPLYLISSEAVVSEAILKRPPKPAPNEQPAAQDPPELVPTNQPTNQEAAQLVPTDQLPTTQPTTDQPLPPDMREAAAQYREEKGRLPSRRKLAEICGTSEWKAAVVLANIKEGN